MSACHEFKENRRIKVMVLRPTLSSISIPAGSACSCSGSVGWPDGTPPPRPPTGYPEHDTGIPRLWLRGEYREGADGTESEMATRPELADLLAYRYLVWLSDRAALL